VCSSADKFLDSMGCIEDSLRSYILAMPVEKIPSVRSLADLEATLGTGDVPDSETI
jgi:hypothetical protein